MTLLLSCSTAKNTARSRWWHSFNAKYNTYYNGSQAYIDGALEKENGNRDNFTDIIPLYTVANKSSKELGKGNFDRAIEKCEKAIKLHSIKRRPEWTKNRKKTARDIEWLSRLEYNPFLWKAWLLMGRSQFMQGEFEQAAITFAYMSRLYQTQPAIYGKARAWLAKCYIENDSPYDAEDVIAKMNRDSLDWRAVKEWDYTYADYYLHQKRFDEAIPYLKKVIKHEMRKKQKAREWYLLGQIYAAQGKRTEAYKAFQHVVRLNPPYEIEFNARIAMTEVMAGSRARQMIGKLKRMAANDNNKEYLDQVYYAIGNIYLAQKDTVNAIAAYEKGNEKGTRNGIEKGVLLLHLGDLYWQQEKFGDAGRCYGQAIGLLDQDRDDYEQLSKRSKILDELTPYTDAIHLQDSLQALAKMSEKDRNAAIDRVIAELKRKEKEERDREAEEYAQQQMQRNGGGNNMMQRQNTTPQRNIGTQKTDTWYFYNPLAVSQGKATFQKLWGKRENVDNWQRINKSVVASTETTDNPDGLTDNDATDMPADSLANNETAAADSAALDPHRREYYLAQIPFTEEQVAASNEILKDGLYHAGVIFKDKLDHLRLSERHLRRLTDQYPDYEHMDDVYYHLFLLYARKGDMGQARAWLSRLQSQYPESQWTALLSDPNYEENMRYGEHMEDSLYAATYEAFKADRLNEAISNAELSGRRFPLGANRDKFIFIGGLSKLNNGDSDGCLRDMKEVVEKFPQSRISELAGMIINGVQGGRKLRGGKFDMGDVWSRRAVVMSDSDSIATVELSAEHDIPFVFMIAYQPDSISENQLLFELARYNFTNFLVRNFDLEIEDVDGLHRMQVKGFRNYDEARQYARMLFKQTKLSQLMKLCRTFIISEKNVELLGNQFSYDEYGQFYDDEFLPAKIREDLLLLDPAEILYQIKPETLNPRLPDLKLNIPPVKVEGAQPDKKEEPKKKEEPVENDEYYELEGF
jgi:tetratricopeptide (TPR) repeat protein